jgi:MYXO-CTERM domain-containing protein
MRLLLLRSVLVPAVLGVLAGCGGAAPRGDGEPVASTSSAFTGSDIASLALANVGGMACKTNSLGGTSFDSSCTGNGGQPEYWCADFARWVWANAGASDTSALTAAAGSFYVYGQTYGTLSDTPAVGDAVVFDYQGGGVADHVAIVTQVNSDGTIETVSGDWNGDNGTEAQFSSTSQVVLNSPAYSPTVGTAPAIMGMTISGYVAPVGVASAAPYGAAFVSQSFPLASTALTMFAGQTLHESIEMKNAGTATWDSSTRLGTTQPRDRDSAFVAPDWVSANRLAQVSGTVKPGDSYTFTFDLHAPSKTGKYLEYFNLVQESIAWFSDPGQGGPPDDDLEAQIEVVAGVRGHLDGSDCTAIAGWSQDQAVPDSVIAVDLYFDAPEADGGAAPLRVQANVSRPDLCTAIGSCVHGFSTPPPADKLDGKKHSVYAYGVAASGDGPNVELPGGPASFTCSEDSAPVSPEGDAGTAGASSGASGATGGGEGATSSDSSGAGSTGGRAGGCSVSAGPARGAETVGWAGLLGMAAFVLRRRRAARS